MLLRTHKHTLRHALRHSLALLAPRRTLARFTPVEHRVHINKQQLPNHSHNNIRAENENANNIKGGNTPDEAETDSEGRDCEPVSVNEGECYLGYDDVGSELGRALVERQTVLCVPSLGDTRGSFRKVKRDLVDRGFRVIAMDIRGQGESSAAFTDYSIDAFASDMRAVLDHAQVERAIVMGCGVSAAASCQFAQQNPHRTSALLLLSPLVRDGALMKKMLSQVCAAATTLFGKGSGAVVWSKLYQSMYAQPPDDISFYVSYLKNKMKEDGRLEALRQSLELSTELSVANAISHLEHIPLHMIFGAKDRNFDDAQQEGEWIASLAQPSVATRIQVIENVGHFPHVEAPEDVVLEVLKLRNELVMTGESRQMREEAERHNNSDVLRARANERAQSRQARAAEDSLIDDNVNHTDSANDSGSSVHHKNSPSSSATPCRRAWMMQLHPDNPRALFEFEQRSAEHRHLFYAHDESHVTACFAFADRETHAVFMCIEADHAAAIDEFLKSPFLAEWDDVMADLLVCTDDRPRRVALHEVFDA